MVRASFLVIEGSNDDDERDTRISRGMGRCEYVPRAAFDGLPLDKERKAKGQESGAQVVIHTRRSRSRFEIERLF